MNMMPKKKKGSPALRTALAGMLAALSVVVLFAGFVTGIMDLTAIAAAALLSAISVIELGGAYPYLIWAVVSVISFMILPGEVASGYLLFGGIYLMGQAIRHGAGATGIGKYVNARECDLLYKAAGVLKLLFGFTGEADHYVGGQRAVGEVVAQTAAQIGVFLRGVVAVHTLEGGVATALQCQVELGA